MHTPGKDYVDGVMDSVKAYPDLFKVVLNQPFQLNGSDFSPEAYLGQRLEG